MENENENLNSSNEENENLNSQNEEEVDVEVIKQKNAELTEANKQLFERAKKAEGFEKDPTTGKWIKKSVEQLNKPAGDAEPPKKSEELSLKDIRALQDVHDDDVDEVVEYAKFKKISIPEAKKDPVIQILLRTKEEERKTAQATNTGGGKRATSKTTGEDLLERAMTSNDIPEKEEDMKKMIEARFQPKEK